MPNNGGPPNKWFKFPVDGKDSDQVLAKLNELAQHDIYSVATTVPCSDGIFVFVGGYKS